MCRENYCIPQTLSLGYQYPQLRIETFPFKLRQIYMFATAAVENLLASAQRLDAYKIAQSEDQVCFQVIHYCLHGLPSKHQISHHKPYWTIREALTVTNGLLLYNQRIVVPASLQQETLSKLHTGHQGIRQCRLRAQSSVW